MLLGPSVVAAVLLIDLIGARSNALFLVAHSSPPIEIAVPGHSAHGGSRCLNPRQGAARCRYSAWSRTNPPATLDCFLLRSAGMGCLGRARPPDRHVRFVWQLRCTPKR